MKGTVKRIAISVLSSVLFVLLAVGLLLGFTGLRANGDTVEVDSDSSTTIQSAIESATTEVTIKLTGNVTESVTIESGKTVTIDLNGYTLTNSGKKITTALAEENSTGDHTIVNYGTLTVIDSSADHTGVVDNITHGSAAVYNGVGGTAYLYGGTCTRSQEAGTDEGGNGNSWYTLKNYGYMVIGENEESAVKVTTRLQDDAGNAVGSFSSLIANGWYDNSKNTNNDTATLVINGGEFEGGINTLKNDDAAVATVNGGKFYNTTQHVVLNWNELTINGGEFTASAESSCVVYNAYGNDTYDKGQCTINGGTFTGNSFVIVSAYDGASVTITDGEFYTNGGHTLGVMQSNGAAGSISVTGGEFYVKDTENEGDYIADGGMSSFVDNTYAEFDETTNTVISYTVFLVGADDTRQGYASIAAALEAASDSSANLVLIRDAQESVTIAQGKTVSLDLNGYTLTNSEKVITTALAEENSKGDHTIVNYGTLTITDSSADHTGTVDNITHGSAAVYNGVGGTAYLYGGSFTRSKEAGTSATANGGNSWYVLKNYGTMVIGENQESAVKVETRLVNEEGVEVGYYSSLISNGWKNGSKNTTKAKAELTINGGEYDSRLILVKNDEYGYLTINGGTFSSNANQAVQNWTKTTITDGTFNSSIVSWVNSGTENSAEDTGNLLTITGGTFNASVQSNYYNDEDNTIDYFYTATQNTVISGGDFTNLPLQAYFADGYSASYNEETKTYVASETTAVALVNGLYGYTTLQDAIDAAGAGATVTLLCDLDTASYINIVKDITLDLGGHKFETKSNIGVLIRTGTTNVTIKNGTVKLNGPESNKFGIASYAIYLTIEGVTVDISNDNSLTYGIISYTTTGSISITGCSVIIEGGTYVNSSGETVKGGYAIYPSSNTTVKNTTVQSDGYGIAFDGAYSTTNLKTELSNGKDITCVTLSLDGVTVTADAFALAGNGSWHGTVFNVKDSTLTSTGACAIYHPQYGDLVLSGKTYIEGIAGIEMRAGSLSVEEGSNVTVVATGAFDAQANGNGSTMSGVAIAISQHSTDLPITVFNLASGTYKGEYAIYEKDLQNSTTEGVEISVTGGTYEGQIASANLTGFITGGSFTTLPEQVYFANECSATYDESTQTYVASEDEHVALINGTYGYKTLQLAVDAAQAGDVVSLVGDLEESITIKSGTVVTLDLNGYTLKNTSTHTITNYGTLTVTDSSANHTGVVDNITHARAAVINYGVAYLYGGTYTRSQEAGTDEGGNGNSWYTIKNYGYMVIGENADSVVKVTTRLQDDAGNAVGSFSSLIANGYQNATDWKQYAYVTTANKIPTLVINGGEFEGGINTLKNDDAAVAEINGGTFKNVTQAAVLNWNYLTINGGTFDVGENLSSVLTGADPTNGDYNNGTTAINGGTFTGAIAYYGGYGTYAELTITGGTFTNGDDLVSSENLGDEYVIYYTDSSDEITVSSIKVVPAGAKLIGGRSASNFAGFTIDENYAAVLKNGVYTIVSYAEYLADAIDELNAYANDLLGGYFYSEEGEEAIAKIVTDATTALNAVTENDFATVRKTLNKAKYDLDAVLKEYEESTLPATIAEYMKELTDYAAAHTDADGNTLIKVVVPTATYAAIYNATSAEEAKFYFDNACAEIDDIRAYRATIDTLIGNGEDVLKAIGTLSDSLFNDDKDGILDGLAADLSAALAAVGNVTTEGEETTSTGLYAAINTLETNIKNAITALQTSINGSLTALDKKVVTLDQIQELLGVTGETDDEGNVDSVAKLIEAAQSEIESLKNSLGISTGGTLTGDVANLLGISDDVQSVSAMISNAQEAIISHINNNVIGTDGKTLAALEAQISALSEKVGTEHGTLSESIATANDALTALQAAVGGITTGENGEDVASGLYEKIAALDSSITTAFSQLNTYLTGAFSALENKLLTLDQVKGVLGITAEDDSTIAARIAELKTALASLASKTDLESMLGLTEETDTVAKLIADAQTHIENYIQSNVVGEYTETLSAISSAITTLSDAFGEVDFEALVSNVSAAKTAIEAVQDSIGTLDENQTLATLIQAAIDATNGVKSDLSTAINNAIATTNTKVDALKEDIATYGTKIGDVYNLLVNLGNAQTALSNALEELDESLSGVGGDTEEILEKIAQSQTTLDSIGVAVNATVTVETSKETAKVELDSWLNDYIDKLLAPAGSEASVNGGAVSLAIVVYADSQNDLESKLNSAFSKENAALVLKYYNEAVASIEAATTTEEINNAVSVFKTQVAMVEVIEGVKTPDNTGVIVLLVILVVLVVVLVVLLTLVFLKKKGGHDGAENSAEEKPAPAEEASAEPVEEAPVEEAPAEPVEETPAEEALAEPVGEAPAEPAEPAGEAEVAIAVGAEAEADEEWVERYDVSFLGRLNQADPVLQIGCGTLTDLLTSYKGVKARDSWKQRRFGKGRTAVAYLLFKGKRLCLALALDPKQFEGTKYRIEDVSSVKRFQSTPTLIKLTSQRKLKYAKELVELLMAKYDAAKLEGKGPEDDVTKYLERRDTMEKLIAKGLAKTYSVNSSATAFFDGRREAPAEEAETNPEE